MNTTHVIGVDPGLVHTGLVHFTFDADHRAVMIDTEVIVTSLDSRGELDLDQAAADVKAWVYAQQGRTLADIYIEGYKPRHNYGTNSKMIVLVGKVHHILAMSRVLLNTGVKKVVKRPLMELLGVWSFTTVTHHQDLRSAARIALLGMLKQESTNRLLTQIVKDHLAGDTWSVHH